MWKLPRSSARYFLGRILLTSYGRPSERVRPTVSLFLGFSVSGLWGDISSCGRKWGRGSRRGGREKNRRRKRRWRRFSGLEVTHGLLKTRRFPKLYFECETGSKQTGCMAQTIKIYNIIKDCLCSLPVPVNVPEKRWTALALSECTLPMARSFHPGVIFRQQVHQRTCAQSYIS